MTEFEKQLLKLQCLILNAQNLQLQKPGGQSQQLTDLVNEHLKLSRIAVESIVEADDS